MERQDGSDRKLLAAAHEAGHAIVASVQPGIRVRELRFIIEGEQIGGFYELHDLPREYSDPRSLEIALRRAQIDVAGRVAVEMLAPNLEPPLDLTYEDARRSEDDYLRASARLAVALYASGCTDANEWTGPLRQEMADAEDAAQAILEAYSTEWLAVTQALMKHHRLDSEALADLTAAITEATP